MAASAGSRVGIVVALVLALAATLLAAPDADARKSRKKAMWGPAQVDGVSQFPIYRDLGVGIYQASLDWSAVAPTRPREPRDPSDPAYRWPAQVDFAVDEARRFGIKVSLVLSRSPRWANGGRPSNWVPRDRRDFADFAVAAAKRYPGVRHWMIWGEPSRRENFMPLRHERRGEKLSRKEGEGVRRYARLLDSAYGSLKRHNPRNLIIGGNTFTTGDVSPLNWVRNLRLPNGRPPRMDLYGHNPFTARRPSFRKAPLGSGFADFSDLNRLRRWVEAHLQRSRDKSIRLFLSEFFLPTDHANHEFNFHVSRKTQASFLKSALRRTRESTWIYTLGWFSLYDDPPQADGLEVNRGLIDADGRKKPAYEVYKRG